MGKEIIVTDSNFEKEVFSTPKKEKSFFKKYFDRGLVYNANSAARYKIV